MTRGIGAVELARETLPEWSVVVLGLLTQLGDFWFVGLLLAACFWRFEAEREGVATVAAATLLGVGAYRTLKHLFALERPTPLAADADPGGLAGVVLEATATANGYGFPSGHATTAAVVYVGLASVLPVGSPRRRYGAAAAVVALVATTRVGLGVHYVVDVVAGAALGVLLVVLSLRLAARAGGDPTPVFAAAVGTAATYLLASAATTQSVLLVGLSAGALAAWVLATDADPLAGLPVGS